MKSQSIVAYSEPLQTLSKDNPQPQDSQVLLKVHYCGVCHSDVHLHDGYFGLGGDKKLDISSSHSLPLTLGHEIEGEVIAIGPEVNNLAIGAKRVVYPWIGCGDCSVCASGDEQLCAKPQALGVNVDGGYADHVLVPHPRYLLDASGIADGLAATYMCSGLTAYGALQKLDALGPDDPIAIVGLGGVGLMGLQFARALFPENPIVAVDIDDAKLSAAQNFGAQFSYNAEHTDAAKQCLKATAGGVAAAVDFVGSETSLGFANRTTRKGGKIVVVGLFGGLFKMPIPMFPLRAITICGSYVGSLAETQAMLELVKAGKIAPIPITQRALEQADQTLNDLRQGRILGRVVLHAD